MIFYVRCIISRSRVKVSVLDLDDDYNTSDNNMKFYEICDELITLLLNTVNKTGCTSD